MNVNCGGICAGCGERISPLSKWCSERCRRTTLYGGTCEVCGARTHGNDGPARAPDRCREHPKPRGRPTASVEKQRLVERLWAEGWSCAEIARQIGSSSTKPAALIGVYRQRGYVLPLRNEGASRANRKRHGA